MAGTRVNPWPQDAVVIICAPCAEFVAEQIRGEPIAETCADCGCALFADSFTIERALSMPERYGRPLRFLCLNCGQNYDIRHVEILEDHRYGEIRRVG